MSFNPKSRARMQDKPTKDLLAIVESGSLSHAAARAELWERGEFSSITAVDLKFRNGHQSHEYAVPTEDFIRSLFNLLVG